jgi:hypothetical protein
MKDDSLSLPSSPYRGIEHYRFVDSSIFFARKTETLELLRSVVIFKGVILFGGSGSGKSSLINAGLLPEVINMGFVPDRIRVQNRPGQEIVIERISLNDDGQAPFLSPSLVNVVSNKESSRFVFSLADFKEAVRTSAQEQRSFLILDQFEEIITLFEETPHSQSSLAEAVKLQEEIIGTLIELLHDDSLRLKVLFSFREDYLAKLNKLFVLAPELPNQYQRLIPPQKKSLETIITGPLSPDLMEHYERKQTFSPALVNDVVEEFSLRTAGDAINLSEVQIVCLELWNAENPDELFQTRRVQGLLEDCLRKELGEFAEEQRGMAIGLLSHMLTSSNTRNFISGVELIRIFQSEQPVDEEVLKETLRALTLTRLVRRELRYSEYFYEIASEFLVPWIIEQKTLRWSNLEQKRLDEEREKELQARLERERLENKARTATTFKLLTVALALFVILAVGAAVLAVVNTKAAVRNASEATKNAQEADEQKRMALAASEEAKVQRENAETLAKSAEVDKKKAEAAAEEARTQKEIARKNEADAKKQTALVEALQIETQQALADVKKQKDIADANVKEAKRQKEDALRSQADTLARVKDLEAKQAEAAINKELADARKSEIDKLNQVIAGLRETSAGPKTNLDLTGKLNLQMLDVYGNPLNERSLVSIKNQLTSQNLPDTSIYPSRDGTITGLTPKNVYQVLMSPPSYRPVSKFVTISPSGVTALSATFLIDSNKVRKVEFPAFNQLQKDAQDLFTNSKAVIGSEGSGPALYNNLNDVNRASILNIIAKARASELDDHKNVMHYLKEITSIKPSSIMAVVSKELIDEAGDSVRKGLLFPVSSMLQNPPPGFEKAGSFRTPDRYGSLQFTLFVKGHDCIALIDIDDKGGLKHLMDVLGGATTTDAVTNPYDINQLLFFYQKLDPGYRVGP